MIFRIATSIIFEINRLGNPAWLDSTMVRVIRLNLKCLLILITTPLLLRQNTEDPSCHVLVLVFVLQGGMEPQIVQAFAAKFDLKLDWLDAKFSWGKYVEETKR